MNYEEYREKYVFRKRKNESSSKKELSYDNRRASRSSIMNARINAVSNMCDYSTWSCFACNHKLRMHSSCSGSRLGRAKFSDIIISQFRVSYTFNSRRTFSMVSIDAICIGDEVEHCCLENLRKEECIAIIIFSSLSCISSCNRQSIVFIHDDNNSLLPCLMNGFPEYCCTLEIILYIGMGYEKSSSMYTMRKKSLPIESYEHIPAKSRQKCFVLIWRFLSSQSYSSVLHSSWGDEDYIHSLPNLLCNDSYKDLDFFRWREVWKWFCSDLYDCGPIGIKRLVHLRQRKIPPEVWWLSWRDFRISVKLPSESRKGRRDKE